MPLGLADAKSRIDDIIARFDAASRASRSVLSERLTLGKAYEAWVLCLLLENLERLEGYSVLLHGSSKVRLKSAPGPINRSYAHFDLQMAGRADLEVWTDVEFTTLSYSSRGGVGVPTAGDMHELDIVVVEAGLRGRPKFEDIRIGVECKATGFAKHMVRAALGVRRELSLLSAPNDTPFARYPRAQVPAAPPSVFLVFSTDPTVLDYVPAGTVFGVDFIHEAM